MKYHLPNHRMPFAAGRVALVAIFFGIVGCGGADKPTAPADVPPTLSVKILSGNNQTVEFGTWVPESLAVRVTNPGGAAVPGTLVNWRIASGTGLFEQLQETKNTVAGHDGSTAVKFRPTRLGTQTVTASVVGALGEPATFRINVVLTLTDVVVISNDGWPWADFVAVHGSANVDVPLGTTISWANVPSADDVDSVRIASTSVPAGGEPFSAVLRAGESFRFVPGVPGTWIWRATYFQSRIPGYEIYEGVTARLTVVHGS